MARSVDELIEEFPAIMRWHEEFVRVNGTTELEQAEIRAYEEELTSIGEYLD